MRMSQTSREPSAGSASVVSKDNLKGSNTSDKEQNLWSSWKEYFNARKRGKKRDGEDDIKSTGVFER